MRKRKRGRGGNKSLFFLSPDSRTYFGGREKKTDFEKNENKNRTFLDEELRIGRGDKGSVFVTARRKGQK